MIEGYKNAKGRWEGICSLRSPNSGDNWKNKYVHLHQMKDQKGEEMTTELTPDEQEDKNVDVKIQGGSSSPVYGLGMIGAWVYFIGRATTNQERIQGFLKGLVWPAYLVHGLLEFLDKE